MERRYSETSAQGNVSSLRKDLVERDEARRATASGIQQQSKYRSEEFLHRLYTKLPREVRDRIYAFLTYEDGDIFISDRMLDESAQEQAQERRKACNPVGARLPDFDSVSAIIAREAAESYYEVNTFLFGSAEVAHRVYQFLTIDMRPTVYPGLRQESDRLQPGIRPHEFIRHLSIGMYLEPFRYEVRPGDRPHELNDLHRTIQSAFTLVENKKSLHVEFFILSTSRYPITYDKLEDRGRYDQQTSERVFLNILEALREPIYDLVHAGSKVSLKFRKSRQEFSPDHIRLFHLTPVQWQEEKENHIRQWGAYTPEKRYIAASMMSQDTLIPQGRQDWGYEYFMSLLPGAPALAEAKLSDWLY